MILKSKHKKNIYANRFYPTFLFAKKHMDDI